MQLFVAFVAIAASASTVLASHPTWSGGKGTTKYSSRKAHPSGWGTAPYSDCLTEVEASNIVTKYTYLLEHPTGPDFNSTATALLADDFVIYNDSINFLARKPLNTASYPSKAAFIAGQAKTPSIPIVTTEEIFHNCNKIAWRWTGAEIGNQKEASKGIITMNTRGGQIATVYSEFNTGAWLVDFGRYPCNSTALG